MMGRIIIAVVFGLLGLWFGSYAAPRMTAQISPAVAAEDSNTTGVKLPRAPNSVEHAKPRSIKTSPIPLVKTLAETTEIRSEFLQSAALYTFAAGKSAAEIEALIGDAKKVLVGGDYRAGTALLIGRYAELDFPAAVDFTLTNAGERKNSWLRAIFHARARLDVEAALPVAAELNAAQKRIAGVAMLNSNTNLSFEQRRRIIDTLGIPEQMAAVTQVDSAVAWEQLKSISNPTAKISAQSQLLMQWAKTDPWVALQKSNEISNVQYRNSVQSVLLTAAFADNSQRVLNWLDAQPDAARREELTEALVQQLSFRDPQQAESLLGRLSAAARVDAEARLWAQRVNADPEGAAAWVAAQETKPSPGDHPARSPSIRTVTNGIVMMLGLSDTASAKRFFDALPQAQRESLGPRYVQTLAQSDALAAVRFIESQSGEAVPDMYQTLGSTWSQQSLSGAREFAREMRSGADRDQMLVGILSVSRLTDEAAQPLLDLISDPDTRVQSEQNRELRARVLRNF